MEFLGVWVFFLTDCQKLKSREENGSLAFAEATGGQAGTPGSAVEHLRSTRSEDVTTFLKKLYVGQTAALGFDRVALMGQDVGNVAHRRVCSFISPPSSSGDMTVVMVGHVGVPGPGTPGPVKPHPG